MPLPQQPIVIEFRDGERSVPPHVASNIAIAKLDPAYYTYEEAVRLSEDALMKAYLQNFQQDMIYKHFRDNR
jgi:hypothetical protein